LDDPLVAVMGSVTRANTLSILAGTRIPQTAYRIAKIGGLSAPNVYLELRRLEKAGVAARRPDGWVLVNDRVRGFCEGLGPLFKNRFSLHLRGQVTRDAGGEVSATRGVVINIPSPRGPESKLLREFSTSPTKNALLKAAGLRRSGHRRR